MIRFITTLFLFFTLNNVVFCQKNLSGFISDSMKNSLEGALVSIENVDNNTIIAYSLTDIKGKYRILIEDTIFNKYHLTVRYLGFKTAKSQLALMKNECKDNMNFSLLTDSISIGEVIVIGDAPSVYRNKDTTMYNIKKYIDGTEVVIEDVLKKLPGIEVNDVGKISFKGKIVDKLLLDGDDLFDKNYEIATKNITSTIIESVQAIERYEENKQLYGLVESDKTVLNIKLNEKSKQLNGDFKIGYGNNDYKEGNGNVIFLKQKLKLFGFGFYNNTGVDEKPIGIAENEKYDEIESFIGTSPFNINRLDVGLTKIRGNDNDLRLTGVNFSSNDKIRISGRVSFYKDMLRSYNNNQTKFVLEDSEFIFNESAWSKIEPTETECALVATKDVSNSFKLGYKGHFFRRSNTFSSNVNYQNKFENNNVVDDDLSANNSINLIKRFSDNSAFIFDFNTNFYTDKQLFYKVSNGYSTDGKKDIEQNYSSNNLLLNPSFSFVNKNILGLLNVSFNAVYMNEDTDNLINSSITLPVHVSTTSRLSKKISSNSIVIDNLSTFDKFKIKYGVSIVNKNYNFSQAELQKFSCNSFYFSPKVSLSYTGFRNTKIFASYKFDKKNSTNNSRVNDIVMVSNNSFLDESNTNFKFIDNHAFMLGFTYSNFYNQLIVYSNLVSSFNNKSLTSNLVLDDYFIINQRVFAPGTHNVMFNLGFDKYIYGLRTGLKYKLDFLKIIYFNKINNSSFIRNVNFSINNKLSLKTMLFEDLSLNTFIKYFVNFNRIDNQNNSSKTDFSAGMALYYRPLKNLYVDLNTECLMYNAFSNVTKFYFVDFSFNYSVFKSKITFSLLGKNLTNITKVNELFINEFSETNSVYSILPKRIMLSVKYRF